MQMVCYSYVVFVVLSYLDLEVFCYCSIIEYILFNNSNWYQEWGVFVIINIVKLQGFGWGQVVVL